MNIADWLSDRLGLRPVELTSPLSLDICRTKLQDAIDAPLKSFGRRPVIGRIEAANLTARKRIFYKNSFQTRLAADLSQGEGGTRILCRFSMHPFVVAFAAIWLVIAVLIGCVIFVFSGLSLLGLTTLRLRPPEIAWLGLVVPVVMPFLGFAMARFGLYLARGERQFLIDFLSETLAAHPVREALQTA